MPAMDSHGPVDFTLAFERSPSPYFREALRLARAIPGYACVEELGRERHSVPLTIAAMPVAERLVRLVAGWRGSVIEADGIALYGVEMFRVLGMLACYRRHERSRLGLTYCWGLPDRRAMVPCRLVDAVLPWNPPDDYSDPMLLPGLVRALAADTFAVLCPAFDAASVQLAAAAWAGGEAAPRSSFERLLVDIEVDDLGGAL